MGAVFMFSIFHSYNLHLQILVQSLLTYVYTYNEKGCNDVCTHAKVLGSTGLLYN